MKSQLHSPINSSNVNHLISRSSKCFSSRTFFGTYRAIAAMKRQSLEINQTSALAAATNLKYATVMLAVLCSCIDGQFLMVPENRARTCSSRGKSKIIIESYFVGLLIWFEFSVFYIILGHNF